jgi:hypothetical protein
MDLKYFWNCKWKIVATCSSSILFCQSLQLINLIDQTAVNKPEKFCFWNSISQNVKCKKWWCLQIGNWNIFGLGFQCRASSSFQFPFWRFYFWLISFETVQLSLNIFISSASSLSLSFLLK